MGCVRVMSDQHIYVYTHCCALQLMVGPAKTLFMDEISTGLDSSTTYLIVRCIKNYVHLLKVSLNGQGLLVVCVRCLLCSPFQGGGAKLALCHNVVESSGGLLRLQAMDCP
jgi:hypothetical protein